MHFSTNGYVICKISNPNQILLHLITFLYLNMDILIGNARICISTNVLSEKDFVPMYVMYDNASMFPLHPCN